MTRACRLIELRMDIAIIMLLVAVIMPSLGSAKEPAMKVIPANNIRERGKAEICYASEGGAFLPWRRTIGCGVSCYGDPWGIEQRLLFLCLRENKEVFRCRVFKNLVSRTAQSSIEDGRGGAIRRGDRSTGNERGRVRNGSSER